MNWLLLAFQRRSLLGKDWVKTGPLLWGQELEAFSHTSPDQARGVKILPPGVLCPIHGRGDIPPSFNIDAVWTINYYPGTSKVPYLETYNKLQSNATFPKCKGLKMSEKIDDSLSESQRAHVNRNRPSADILVPMESLKKSTKI